MPARPQTNHQAARTEHHDSTPTDGPIEDPRKIEREIQMMCRRLGLGPGSLPTSLKRPKFRSTPVR
jgi:hypothetical protein